jgi:hypothetical protein
VLDRLAGMELHRGGAAGGDESLAR